MTGQAPTGQGLCYCCATPTDTFYQPESQRWWVWLCLRCERVFVRTPVRL